jgi:hypothetical protein
MAVGGLTIGRGKGTLIATNAYTPFGKGQTTNTMKATHNKATQSEKKEWKFPCLGIGKYDCIVLFRAIGCGVVLTEGGVSSGVGRYDEDWVMSNFTPLPSTESVTLQND